MSKTRAAKLRGCAELALAQMLERGPVSEGVAMSLWPEGLDGLGQMAERGLVLQVGDAVAPGPRMAEAVEQSKPKKRVTPSYMRDVECWAECGRWKAPTAAQAKARPKAMRRMVEGPTAPMWDSHGREYRIRYALDVGNAVVTSHSARDGTANPGYVQELQPRDRGGALLRMQVAELTEGFDARRYLSPAYGPDTGAPVVFVHEGRPMVVAGNGRLMAFRRWVKKGRVTPWREAVLGRWKTPTLGKPLAKSAWPVVRLLETVNGEPATLAHAVELAGASQSSPSGETTRVTEAISEARAMGLSSPLDLGPWEYTRPLTADNWPSFLGTEWAKAFLKKLSRAKRATVADPDTGPRKVEAVLLGTLPADAIPPDAAPPGAVDALLGALPSLWTLESERAQGLVAESWSLLGYLPAAWTWVVRAGAGGARRAAALAEDEHHQSAMFDDPALTDHGVRPEGIALAVLLLKAGARQNPREAAAALLRPVVEAARSEPPAQVALVPPAPVAPRLLRFAGVKWGAAEDNPGGRRGAIRVYGERATLELRASPDAANQKHPAGWDTGRGTFLTPMPRWYALAARGQKTVAVDLSARGPGTEEARYVGRAGWPEVAVLHAPEGDEERYPVVSIEYYTTGTTPKRRRHRVAGNVYYYPQTGALVGLRAKRS